MRIFPGDGDPRHGTTNGYSNLKCRCQPCRDAWAKTHGEYTHRVGIHRTRDEYLKELSEREPPPHGTTTRYGRKWRCRCDACRFASMVARASQPSRSAS